jgi:hypothetical protein
MYNFGFSEILGILFFLFPILIYLTNVLFDGLGYFKDHLFYSTRRR